MIRVAAVGDLMVSDSSTTVGFGVRSRFPGPNLAQVFVELAPRLSAADLAIGNLEAPLIAEGKGPTRWARDQMRGDPIYARVLRDAGFTALSVANNHAVQHGESGFAETVATLEAAAILPIGVRGEAPWSCKPAIWRSHSTSVALLGYSWRPRQYGLGAPPYAEVEPAAVLADVARARSAHDFVIVSLHWGEEFVAQPSDDEVRFGRAVVDAGAALVLGHHPHVARPVERHGPGLIAYSLGNAIADMVWMEDLRTGLLLEAALERELGNATVTRIRIDNSYVARLDNGSLGPVAVRPLSAVDYRRAAAAKLALQRRAAYWHAAVNVHRFAPGTFATLAATTVRNKLRGLATRLRRR